MEPERFQPNSHFNQEPETSSSINSPQRHAPTISRRAENNDSSSKLQASLASLAESVGPVPRKPGRRHFKPAAVLSDIGHLARRIAQRTRPAFRRGADSVDKVLSAIDLALGTPMIPDAARAYYRTEYGDTEQIFRDFHAIRDPLIHRSRRMLEKLDAILANPIVSSEIQSYYGSEYSNDPSQAYRDVEAFRERSQYEALLPVRLALDERMCGKTQVSGRTLLALDMQEELVDNLIDLRCRRYLWVMQQIVANAVMAWGVSARSPSRIIGGVGRLASSIGGNLEARQRILANRELSLELGKRMEAILEHEALIAENLGSKGFTDAEREALKMVATNIALAEYDGSRIQRVKSAAKPLGAAALLATVGDVYIAAAVAIVGCVGLPAISKHYYENADKPRAARMRAATSAANHTVVRQLQNEEAALIDKMNFLNSFGDYFFFLLCFVHNDLLSAGMAISTAFSTQMLGSNRATERHERNVELFNRIAEFYQSPSMLLSRKSWDEHTKDTSVSTRLSPNSKTAVIFDDFGDVALPDGSTLSMRNISECIESGSVTIWQAPSGFGKTFLLRGAVRHVVEHSGKVILYNDGNRTNVHQLARAEIDKYILIVDKYIVKGGSRLVDNVRNEFNTVYDHPLLSGEIKLQYEEIGVRMADNLLEDQLHSEKSIFLPETKAHLKTFRATRLKWFNDYLAMGEGNMLNLNAERFGASLSEGERVRVATIIGFIKLLHNPSIMAAFFDEPYAHVDKDPLVPGQRPNHELQDMMLERVRALASRPGIVMISHDDVPRLQQIFDAPVHRLADGTRIPAPGSKQH